MIGATCSFADSQNVADFGAIADEKTDNTIAIQSAIDKCNATGGGEVLFPNKTGVYLSKRLNLKSNVVLNIPQNVVLRAIVPAVKKRFIEAESAENIGITGGGTIDGNGDKHPYVRKPKPNQQRPHLIRFRLCKNVRITDINLIRPANMNIVTSNCHDVMIRGVKILAHSNHNNDGIDIEGSNITISDCIIDCTDDALCFKSNAKDSITKNVTITNCVIASNCNLIKFGTTCLGGFKNITISNITMHRSVASPVHNWKKTLKWAGIDEEITGLAGIALEAVDGGFFEDVNISNISMSGVQTPIFIRVDNRKKYRTEGDTSKSYMKNVIISSITAKSDSLIANSITAVENHSLKNIVIRDCFLNMKGAKKELITKNEINGNIQEAYGYYPENRMFKSILPAYGFFLRRAHNVTFDNVQMSYYGAEDTRPAFFIEKSTDISIINCKVQKPANNQPVIQLKESPKPYTFSLQEKDTPFLN